MKAVILAAGKGARLRPLTDTVPKVMIPVCGRPVLEYHLEGLARAGVGDVFVNLHHLPDRITSHFGDGGKWGVRIRYSYEPEILGTAGAVKKLESELRGEPFLVVYGDNFVLFDFRDFISWAAVSGGIGAIAVFEKENVVGSGIVEVGESGRVSRFVEKPQAEEAFSRWVNAGIYYLDDEALNAIPPGRSDFGHDVFPDMLRKDMSLFAYKMKDRVWALDNPELLEELRDHLASCDYGGKQ